MAIKKYKEEEMFFNQNLYFLGRVDPFYISAIIAHSNCKISFVVIYVFKIHSILLIVLSLYFFFILFSTLRRFIKMYEEFLVTAYFEMK